MRRVRVILAVAASAALVATGLSATSTTAGAAPAPLAASITIAPGVHKVAKASAAPPTTAQCEATFGIACYGAGQIEQAYNLPPLYSRGITGRGQTIVIVDPFGSPTMLHDLKVFDRTYGLPDPPSFKEITPAGALPPYTATDAQVGWAGETTLDVEYAHAIAPGANILLVATPVSEEEGTSGFPEIVTAEKYVIDHHLGGVISQSFGATEETFPTVQSLLALRGAYTDAYAKGVTVLAATGDSGAADVMTDEETYYLNPVTSWPPSDPLVTAVGGTQLHLNAAGQHTTPDTVWNDTFDQATQEYIFGDDGPNPLAGGSGKSAIFPRPSYQNGVRSIVGSQRAVPDISMSGACNGAVNTYQSFGGQDPGWYQVCGTSESTPLFAGIVALADQVAGHPLGLINPALYTLSALHAPGLTDVTSGSTTVSFEQPAGVLRTVKGGTAGRGFDLASGVGTVNGAWFVPELAALAGRTSPRY
jgi:subtilase family serine protease